MSINHLSSFPSVAQPDIWWWCGGKTLRAVLPHNWARLCIPINLIMPVTVLTDLTLQTRKLIITELKDQ